MTKEEALDILKNGEKSEIRDAMEVLQAYPCEDVVSEIVNSVMKFKTKAIIEMTKETLMGFKSIDSVVVSECLRCFESDEPKVRAMAIEVIASFWNDSVDYLDILVKNSDYNMRKYGIDVLASVLTRKSLENLILLLDDKNPNVKYSAIEALAYFENYRDRILEIFEDQLEKVNTSDMYGVASIVQAIMK
ncbi:MAG: HEAT repeat domain-containing protein, partial [Epsilonproteobacteria bacterium]|nr:HEAT repeat domain-containing protein [Campylobacterota bacterium]